MTALTWFLTDWHWLAIIWALAVLTGAVALAVIGVRWWREDREWDEDDEEQVQDREIRRVPELPQRHRLGTLAASLDSHDQSQAGMHLDGYAAGMGHQPAHDWRSETAEQLSPAHLDAENLPGQLHYMDTWLGRPGDGSEHTALRVRREGEAMLARVEAARRELAAECGIRYVPMELVAA